MPLPFLQYMSIFFLLIPDNFHTSRADVGTAAKYSPPYLPTDCYGYDPTQFPTNNLFGAAGDGIWDDGASCGRQYLVRCISARNDDDCDPTQILQIKIVDRVPPTGGTTMALSDTAFGNLVTTSPDFINIEFQQV